MLPREKSNSAISVRVRPLRESDLAEADRIFRTAFGTFIGLPDPLKFAGDAEYVRTRWLADPEAAIGAEIKGELVGSNFLTRWGSFGYFGPLTVRPDLWDRGIAKKLMEETMPLFDKWGTKHVALFTFADSGKHLALYQKFGFWPRFLTTVMSKPIGKALAVSEQSTYSASGTERDKLRDACNNLTNTILEGLDVTREIEAVENQKIGDTVLLWERGRLAGLAVCHIGAGSEAGSGNCYVKFGCVGPGRNAIENFERLLQACEFLASKKNVSRLVAGMNTARHQAYQVMIGKGFWIDFEGVVMQKPNEPAYNRPDVFIIDDLR